MVTTGAISRAKLQSNHLSRSPLFKLTETVTETEKNQSVNTIEK